MSELSQGLPTTEQLLVSGGDARIALDVHGLNKYGCRPYPDTDLLSLGSSTASVISPAGFAAAEQLRERLLPAFEKGDITDALVLEFGRIKEELLAACGLSDAGIALVFASSGTDAHRIVARSVAQYGSELGELTIVMVEQSETGSGVAMALDVEGVHTVSVPLRSTDGAARPQADIDAEVVARVDAVITAGGRVLLIMVDQSKTGLIAPSPGCAAMLQHRHTGRLDVLVDACQFRLAAPTLRAYLQQDFMVAVTGSKFLTGPSFSAALLLPGQHAQRLGLSEALTLNNPGLLLRWEAALVELRRFNAIPQAAVADFMQDFATAINHRLGSDPRFLPLQVHEMSRQTRHWDHIQSIFPFLLRHAGASLLDRDETLQVYRQLQVDLSGDAALKVAGMAPVVGALRCQFGQPVNCGTREGRAVSALRLCLSARLISDDAGQKVRVIDAALAALDKVAALL